MHHPFRDMRAALSEKESAKRPDYAGIGQLLHDTRETYGITLEQAARDLKIKTSYLTSIEAGQLEKIPGMVYAKGYLRMYAEYLRINMDTMLTLVRPVTAVKDHPAGYSPAQEPKRLQQAMMLSLAILAALFLIWQLASKERETRTTVTAVRSVPRALLQESSGVEAFHRVPQCFAAEAASYPPCYVHAEQALPTTPPVNSVLDLPSRAEAR